MIFSIWQVYRPLENVMKNIYKISHTQKSVFIHINKLLHVNPED